MVVVEWNVAEGGCQRQIYGNGHSSLTMLTRRVIIEA
jgi:hypothetical protein